MLAWRAEPDLWSCCTRSIAEDIDGQRDLAREVAHNVQVIVESAVTGLGLAEVRREIPQGSSAALLGGSGVGKSTLVNRLLGEELLATAEVRVRDDKGRHTTVARELVSLGNGGVVIDTPGMRGLALWGAESGLASAFPDVDSLAEECRFRDCTHLEEPGCAVTGAVADGNLPARRLESYRALRVELTDLARKQDERVWAAGERASKGAKRAPKWRRGADSGK